MKKVRCAIYTRKSSEEGLEQDFNSLHAQREACAAYILSQASEGWSLLPEVYDDGGLSGGTLERPALQRLLGDIEAGKIDIVVVYKVDRLTRSLIDFAKLVETMDRTEVSFVSVTQSFNTTNSMGRLTLNMLLSFAQFEREVTAERIRDKIAASKAKGMWMGGIVPLGYEASGRTLAIVKDHAMVIRDLFRRYCEIGNVRLLKEQLEDERMVLPERLTATGRKMGGVPFTRGQIYKILSNPIYIGEIHHKGQTYDGQHEAIIDPDLWAKVQEQLAANRQGEQRVPTIKVQSLLAEKVFDEHGEPLGASHACKGKVRYRYYVARERESGGTATDRIRIPARELEVAIVGRLVDALDDPLSLLALIGAELDRSTIEVVRAHARQLARRLRSRERKTVRDIVNSVTVGTERIALQLDANQLRQVLSIPRNEFSDAELTLDCKVRLKRTGRAMRLVEPGGQGVSDEVDRSLVQLLAQARKWWERLSDGQTTIAALAREEGINDSWISRVVRLAFLSPEIVDCILAGTQPAALNGTTLTTGNQVSVSWTEQAKLLGLT
jgi:site-specific DNA recombinase